MFVWAQERLSIPQKTIKSIILIENILAAFSMEMILYSIRDHIIGLNCGIWDYSASIISKFGNNREFLIPDRNKYVNVSKKFLSAYMRLVIRTSHEHGGKYGTEIMRLTNISRLLCTFTALATGGMAAKILPAGKENVINDRNSKIIDQVYDAKKAEIEMGVDGFMVHDIRLVSHMNKLWEDTCGTADNQLNLMPKTGDIKEKTLLEIPKGGVTIDGLRYGMITSINDLKLEMIGFHKISFLQMTDIIYRLLCCSFTTGYLAWEYFISRELLKTQQLPRFLDLNSGNGLDSM